MRIRQIYQDNFAPPQGKGQTSKNTVNIYFLLVLFILMLCLGCQKKEKLVTVSDDLSYWMKLSSESQNIHNLILEQSDYGRSGIADVTSIRVRVDRVQEILNELESTNVVDKYTIEYESVESLAELLESNSEVLDELKDEIGVYTVKTLVGFSSWDIQQMLKGEVDNVEIYWPSHVEGLKLKTIQTNE